MLRNELKNEVQRCDVAESGFGPTRQHHTVGRRSKMHVFFFFIKSIEID